MRETFSKGLMALTVDAERREMTAVLNSRHPLRLRYHKGSEMTGRAYKIDCRLWDVLSPIPGYPPSGGLNGFPTLSLDGLKARGLL